jgi:hypothetical protein
VILLGLLIICVATVPLLGGRLGRLGDIHFRRSWAGIAALLIQFAILRAFPEGDAALHAGLHLVSYGLLFYFLAGNLRVPGLAIMALGGTLNAIAIAANDGVMPARPEALASAGILQVPGEFVNSGAVADAKLWFLGDVFALPAGFPLANVFSVGDIVLVLGAFLLLHRQSGSRLAAPLARASRRLWDAAARVEVLRDNRGFRRLWIAQAISEVGDWVFIPAVYAAMVSGEAKASELALLLIAQVGPGMLVGLFGGPFIDRFSRKWLMVGTDLLRAGAVASLLFVGRPSLLVLRAEDERRQVSVAPVARQARPVHARCLGADHAQVAQVVPGLPVGSGGVRGRRDARGRSEEVRHCQLVELEPLDDRHELLQERSQLAEQRSRVGQDVAQRR